MAHNGGVDDLARFWTKVDCSAGSDECWPWIGPRRGEYGRFHLHGRTYTAHRWLLGELRGVPLSRERVGEEDACHRCDNPPCCNPAHLYVGTRKQNIGDAVERSRLWMLQRTHCPQGHPYVGDNLIQKANGARACRTCARAQQHQHRTVERTHCRSGHELVDGNVLLCRNGTRKCRTCDAARVAKLRG